MNMQPDSFTVVTLIVLAPSVPVGAYTTTASFITLLFSTDTTGYPCIKNCMKPSEKTLGQITKNEKVGDIAIIITAGRHY